MKLTTRKLLTIITESALENLLLQTIESLGAKGYTITDARGKGSRGRRDASWAPHGNIRLEILCDDNTAHAICSTMWERYYENYSMVMYLSDVDVLRPEKF